MKWKKLLVITGLLVFFLGLPGFGLLYFWQDMHRKIEADASRPVTQLAELSLATWDDETIGRRLGPEVDYDKFEASLDKWRTDFGPLVSLGEGRVVKTWAHEFKDQTWQFARMEFPATFEKGRATVRFTGTRLYLEKEWKIAEIEMLP